MPRTVVMAFGGNAITRPGEKGTFAEQKANVAATCRQLVDLVREGYRLVLTHGNGPQVGNMLIKNEIAKDIVPAMPLDVLVSNTQGSIGYAIQQALGYELACHGLKVPVASIVTQVVVAADDPAFQNPTKPVGPFYSQEEAVKLMKERGYRMVEDSHRGWRRVVPSPRPLEIIEREAIKALIRAGIIVVAAGGGGIPVVRRDDGSLAGVEAVIDKDRAATILASQVEAEVLFLLTDVERVCLDYGLPTQREVERLTVSEARRYLAEGQFPPGSMGPKVEAAIAFVEAGGEKAIIGSLARAAEAVAGRSGTEVVAG
ncbi:Carbamate kinase 1 [Moorella thermoacetica]|uniref:Carbamate kinase n=1 Tax=Neomoorella thermoacetica TaxID=1525 RepID=A0AAC9HKN6_NEOTH|nr:carbamate kinase [Moorella thermoacetica]AOQ24906.1 Carbamate kinase 1 [Moorella thermoacetica]OIQ62710.1 carbamate kinase 1 [Moorella thermoacetica]TYL15552.1 Carbamate kinase 1 [Moorella thermoacetica]